MVHASKVQIAANAVCFHSHTKDKRYIFVPEEARPTSTGVLQPITTTVTENGVFALVIITSFSHYSLKVIWKAFFLFSARQVGCKDEFLIKVEIHAVKVINLPRPTLPQCSLGEWSFKNVFFLFLGSVTMWMINFSCNLCRNNIGGKDGIVQQPCTETFLWIQLREFQENWDETEMGEKGS